jgi:CBS domain-containing protein
LEALRLHNGTIWRWNRPCYGIATRNGIHLAHLRVENRVMPSGPSIKDEAANAAFFFGMMNALPDEYGAIEKLMNFEDAKSNFLRAARYGLKTQLTWLGGRDLPMAELILNDLLPLARSGLKHAGINERDTDEYLGIIEERVRRDQTGALWALRSLSVMGEHGTRDQHQSSLTAAMIARQQTGEPVDRWPLVDQTETQPSKWRFQTIGDFMTTDLFTVHPDDLVDLAASVMNWKHVRHVPVEDEEGRLVGLVSHRDLLRWLSHRLIVRDYMTAPVKAIMKPAPVTVSPQTTTLEAIAIMRNNGFGCLPVVEAGRLVGIVTAQDFLDLSADLIETHLKGTASTSNCPNRPPED